MHASHLSLIPIISEKAYAQSQANTYVFKVPTNVNKQQVAAAVAGQYSVGVVDVRMVVAKGKLKRAIRGGKPVTGRRSNTKKAYVTLAEGSRLDFFSEPSEEEKK